MHSERCTAQRAELPTDAPCYPSNISNAIGLNSPRRLRDIVVRAAGQTRRWRVERRPPGDSLSTCRPSCCLSDLFDCPIQIKTQKVRLAQNRPQLCADLLAETLDFLRRQVDRFVSGDREFDMQEIS